MGARAPRHPIHSEQVDGILFLEGDRLNVMLESGLWGDTEFIRHVIS